LHTPTDRGIGLLDVEAPHAERALAGLQHAGVTSEEVPHPDEVDRPTRTGEPMDDGPGGEDGEERYALEGQCTVAVTKPCDVAAVLGTMLELAQEAGVATDEIDFIETKGWTTDEEVLAALTAVQERLPASDRDTGTVILETAEAVIRRGERLAADDE
jgi:hypothetical protein